MRLILMLTTGLILAHSAMAQEQEIDPQASASCMMQNTTAADEEALRYLLITALQENKVEANKAFNKVTQNMVRIATESCGINIADFQKPSVRQTFRVYGESVGNKVIQEAFAKVGVPTGVATSK